MNRLSNSALISSDRSTGPEITFADLDTNFKSGDSDLFRSLTPQQGSDVLSKMTAAADVSVQR